MVTYHGPDKFCKISMRIGTSFRSSKIDSGQPSDPSQSCPLRHPRIVEALLLENISAFSIYEELQVFESEFRRVSSVRRE